MTLKTLGIVALAIGVLFSVTVSLTALKSDDVVTIRERIVGGATNYNELGLGALEFDTHTGVITQASASSSGYWINNTGQDKWVSDLTLVTSGTASSAFRAFVATSSINGNVFIGTGAAAPKFNTTRISPVAPKIISGWFIATSSQATSTKASVLANNTTTLYGSSTAAADGEGQEWLPMRVRPNEYVLIYLTQESSDPCLGTGATPNFCETATSTARGFDLLWKIDTFATTTRPND